MEVSEGSHQYVSSHEQYAIEAQQTACLLFASYRNFGSGIISHASDNGVSVELIPPSRSF